MKLSSLTRRENLHDCPFGDRREMASKCRYVWLRYFDTIKTGEPPCDVMIWEIGSTVAVRPGSSRLDESGKHFVRPFSIYFEVKGFAAARRKIERQKNVDRELIARQLADLEGKLRSQLEQAILKGFKYKNVVAGYREFQNSPLTVVMTSKDAGLHNSEFALVWKNKSGPSIELIAKRAKANKGKRFPMPERNPSIREIRLEGMKEENKQWKIAVKKRVADEKVKVEKHTPRVRRKLLAAINKGEQRRQQQLKKSPHRKTTKTSGLLLSLGDGNQLEKPLVPKIHVDRLVEVIVKYPWSEFDLWDNRMWEYMSCLMNPTWKMTKVKDRREWWLKLNRAQKVFHAMLTFSGETDNGGVWQFLFNEPQLSLAALEAMEAIGESTLARDYQAALEELLGKAKTISGIRRKADDRNLSNEKRWQAFAEGYGELVSARKIEKYFFRKSYKKKLFKRISDYVESKLHLLTQIQS